jgi:hypothetical protein
LSEALKIENSAKDNIKKDILGTKLNIDFLEGVLA